MNRWVRGAVLAVVLLSIIPCSTKAQQVPSAETGHRIAAANRAFAFDLYHQLADKDPKQNLFISPYSLSNVLVMLGQGARGTTADQIDKVLRFVQPGQPPAFSYAQVHSFMGTLNQHLSRPAAKVPARTQRPDDWHGPYELNLANALWCDNDYPLIPNFVNILQKYYGVGGIFPVDFGASSDVAHQSINAWCERQTNQKIKDLIGPGAIDQYTRLVLTSAVYFKGAWVHPFTPNGTRPQLFHLNADESIQAPLMTGDIETLFYVETPQLEAVSLPYSGRQPTDRDLEMVILLPKSMNGMAAMEGAIDGQSVADLIGSMSHQLVVVQLPKFKVTSQFDLNQMLSAMGMPDAFSIEKADLSGISPIAKPDKLHVTSVLHKTFIDVNETETEAAAVTSVGGGAGGGVSHEPPKPRIINFRADHPYLFMIYHRPSETILFMGRMMNPNA